MNLRFIVFLVVIAIIFCILAVALNSCLAEWAVGLMAGAYKMNGI